MKKVLGLDLGTTSIGWALVNQSENQDEKSSIIKAGVRVNPLTTDEKDAFEKGKAITTNADRTLKRGMRRSLQRYKLRRDTLIATLKREGWINDSTILSEDGPDTTHETLRLRAESAEKEITLEQLARVLLSINKKRGYKSSRKSADADADGHLINGMEVAKILYDKNLTPAQYSLLLIKDGSKGLPDYYRSDLEKEYDAIWSKQSSFYPEYLTEEFKNQLKRQGRQGVGKIFFAKYDITTADNKGKEKKRVALEWRVKALSEKMPVEEMAYVLADIRGEVQSSSGYLGAISDRSKELFFGHITVGQYLYNKIQAEPGYSTRNKVFYRQDYLDEFETIWECQKQYHNGLTDSLKKEIRDIIIFYQRPLKSQKGLISFCEFESKQVKVIQDGKTKIKTHGCRVAPKSSPLFQEFKIWQVLNNLIISDATTGESGKLSTDQMDALAKELTIQPKLSASKALELLGYGRSRRFEMNYKNIEGNRTMSEVYKKCLEIVDLTGNGEFNIEKNTFESITEIITSVFNAYGFGTEFLSFNSDLDKVEYEQQPSFKLWHLLYSYEGDKSATGDESLIQKVSEICKLPAEYAKILCSIKFQDDYASLSHKAMRKILPHLKGGNTYDEACALAGYRHSDYKTAEEIENKQLKDRLEVLPKGALRNPVVEKIVNQMINVVNAVADTYGKPDEIHIELARELKQSKQQRELMTNNIAIRTKENETITKILKEEFGLTYVSQNDILRYRLYDELRENGYKTLYSNKEIPRDLLFSKSIDIEHIIPQARMFNDSYANKTLEFRDVNIEKGAQTAKDYILAKYGQEGYITYSSKINDLFTINAISKAKRDYLLMSAKDIPEDFLNRDLTNSQYIAKKSREILEEYVKIVMPTSGSVTARLREDWQLVDVMKELNIPKYRSAGLTEYREKHDGNQHEDIKDWSKRNDHRHHAMDAITIAFTKPSHIQILNNLNADSDTDSAFFALKRKEMQRNGVFNPPMPLGDLRFSVKKALESTLVSIKAKNKVVTKNVNKTKGGEKGHKQQVLTPRGLLHKEQVYGKRLLYKTYEVSVGGKMTAEEIEHVADKRYRDALRQRLAEFQGNSKKAFTGSNSLDKNPIYLAAGDAVPEKVKCVKFETVYSIRKEIAPGFKIEKVADKKVREILQKRLDEFEGNSTRAFSNLDENPIWLDKEHSISIKRATIFENFELFALHDKTDKDGKAILDAEGNTIPADFVNLRNNHHVAIYRDESGKLQELVVPFIEALQRITVGMPAVDKYYKKSEGWQFLFSMKTNEMFVFPNEKTGFRPEEVDLLNPENYKEISQNLYRVQKLSSGKYYFRHHVETLLDENYNLKDVTWKCISSTSNLDGAVKVRINHIGQIVSVGEYD